jgi:hypothetical protein
MTRVFDGHLQVHYGQAYVSSTEDGGVDLEEAFQGQANGLCGAACPGMLFLITGLHTGHVGFTVDVLDARPEIDDSWGEIVEVSFLVGEQAVKVRDWYGETIAEFLLSPGSYRIRYCARNMDLGHEVDTILEDKDAVDFYSLTFWPESASTDQVIKQTSQDAEYWHKSARGLKG